MQLRFNDKYCENSKHEKIRENKMVLLWFTVIHCEFTGKVTKIQNIKKNRENSTVECYALWFNEKYCENSKHKSIRENNTFLFSVVVISREKLGFPKFYFS